MTKNDDDRFIAHVREAQGTYSDALNVYNPENRRGDGIKLVLHNETSHFRRDEFLTLDEAARLAAALTSAVAQAVEDRERIRKEN
jgi:hypothetical protein